MGNRAKIFNSRMDLEEKKIVELSEKEAEFLMDANRIWPFLPIKKELIERLDFGVEKI